jgi:beta-galactosidase/beta-glucuronidase
LLGADFRGRVRHVRRFGRPTGLDSGERVWLVCDGATLTATVVLNGTPLGAILGPTTPARFDVTERLLPRNELVIEVEFPAIEAANRPSAAEVRCGGLTGEVRLEICG